MVKKQSIHVNKNWFYDQSQWTNIIFFSISNDGWSRGIFFFEPVFHLNFEHVFFFFLICKQIMFCVVCTTKGSMEVEVIVAKVKHHRKSVILPLRSDPFEHDDADNNVKNAKVIAKIIYDAIKEYKSLPDPNADVNHDSYFCLITISTNGAYRRKLNATTKLPQIDYDIKELIYTVPFCIGCVHEGGYELRNARKRLLTTTTNYSCWIGSVAVGLSILTTPK